MGSSLRYLHRGRYFIIYFLFRPLADTAITSCEFSGKRFICTPSFSLSPGLHVICGFEQKAALFFNDLILNRISHSEYLTMIIWSSGSVLDQNQLNHSKY